MNLFQRRVAVARIESIILRTGTAVWAIHGVASPIGRVRRLTATLAAKQLCNGELSIVATASMVHSTAPPRHTRVTSIAIAPHPSMKVGMKAELEKHALIAFNQTLNNSQLVTERWVRATG